MISAWRTYTAYFLSYGQSNIFVLCVYHKLSQYFQVPTSLEEVFDTKTQVVSSCGSVNMTQWHPVCALAWEAKNLVYPSYDFCLYCTLYSSHLNQGGQSLKYDVHAKTQI